MADRAARPSRGPALLAGRLLGVLVILLGTLVVSEWTVELIPLERVFPGQGIWALRFASLAIILGGLFGFSHASLARRRAEEALRNAHTQLERREEVVQARTSELATAVANLERSNRELDQSRLAAIALADDAVEDWKHLEVANAALRDEIAARTQTEVALRASEERFRRAVVDSPFPMLLHAEDGAILQANNVWCEITGYAHEELTTIADWTERAYGERRESVQADIDALYGLDGRKAEGDYNIRTSGGAMRVWDFSSAPLGRLADGRRLVLSMAMDVTERRAAEREVQQLNAGLEQRVADRTVQLEAANKELEAFSYSVSHDLRAPLRAIDGFSRILTDEHADGLTVEGRRVLGVICAEAWRMGQLIDDLLAFSKMSRQPMLLSELDIETMSRDVFDQCAARTGGRTVRLQLQALPKALGDSAMIRQVLVNLMSNAIKFTGTRDAARIDVEGSIHGNETIYHVRDNGVGFDMRYAGKLFGVFQRLHSDTEFEGSGVGLALVQRIIQRHGGRVWGEGSTDHGAAFHFALPRHVREHGHTE